MCRGVLNRKGALQTPLTTTVPQQGHDAGALAPQAVTPLLRNPPASQNMFPPRSCPLRLVRRGRGVWRGSWAPKPHFQMHLNLFSFQWDLSSYITQVILAGTEPYMSKLHM